MSTRPIHSFGPVPRESAAELYENAPCGYLSTAVDGRIVRVNRTFVGWMGCPREELTHGKRFADLLTVGGKMFYETHFALLLRLHGEVREVAFDFVCQEGHVMPAFVSAVEKRAATGMPILNRITVFDATERRGYERELLLARKQAEDDTAELARVNSELSRINAALAKVNRELAQFAYAASHDLQEPLRTVMAFAQRLETQYKDVLDEHARSYIQQIVDGSGRMQTLIRDLLALSQFQDSHLTLWPTDLRQTLAIARSNLHSAIERSSATITHGNLPVMTVDPGRIAQVFQNLIGNAIKYRRRDEAPRVHISVSKKVQHEWLVAVEDNGIGFEACYAEKIFEVFKRLHGREVPGTGIGLALCKKIVESHGGRIWATSLPGVGSCFYFTIPDPVTT